MEPFQLLCPGCASKLKVRNRSAIGQRLACPRCREMILVEAPEGHDIGESKLGMASFDDMDLDALLDNRAPASPPKPKKPVQVSAEIPRPKRPTQRAPNQKQQTRPNQQTPSNPNQQANPELAPGQEWVNPATKKKQRMVLLTMAAIGSLLAIGAVTFFLINGFGSGNNNVAEVPDENVEQNDDLKAVTDTTPDDTAIADADSETDPPADAPDITTPDIDEPEIVMPEIGDAPPIIGIPDTPPEIPGTEGTDSLAETKPPIEGFDDDSDLGAGEEPVAKLVDPNANLNSILAESGTSLLEIQTAASNMRSDLTIGTPKYFFDKVGFEDADPSRQKDQIILGVKFDQQPLQTVLHELAAISGLRLTIDAPTIAVSGADVNPKVSLQIENESTGTVIRKIAESVGLVAIESDRGFWITAANSEEFETESIGIALIIENEDDGHQLVQLIRRLIFPGTWTGNVREEDIDGTGDPKGKIEFVAGKLELNHSPAAIREVQKLVDGLKALARNDVAASELLQPVPWINSGKFAADFTPTNSIRLPIGKFFRNLRDNNGVQLIADWHSLGNAGWTSDSMAPGWIDERTVGDVVKETAHGMGASVYIVDEETVWITSQDVADSIFLLKLYPLAKLADGRLTTERLEAILSDSIGEPMRRPGVAFFVLSKQKLVAVRAPQLLHRQVRAVLREIE
ncbi:hypothetical protein [Mariniblastus fucicola]|uniref:Uncharacterized protein n=1 Tax=Mariniblastus fucicola TaxID=980251 RepID=A0A5B9P4I2_9BACT|nr:hypothetical protein [Mariniblastus fucicola]QEG21278.1 hypothetical protein MFFC18_11330 [Mariniblastus fucicola]